MSRRKIAAKRRILPDRRFGSELVSKFVNHLMMSGKKSVSERIFYGAIDKMAARLKADPLELLEKALDNVKPWVEVRSRRVGGATYQIPVDVRPVRRITLAIRWIIDSARKRPEKGMMERLARELQDAFENKGMAIKIRQDKEKMAQANQAFASYRW